MNVVSLATHGLSAISVYSDTVGVRLVCGAASLTMAALAAIGGVVYTRLFTSLAVPGWASYSVGILAVIVLNSMLLMLVFVIFTLQLRNAATFLPLRDFRHYILESIVLHG